MTGSDDDAPTRFQSPTNLGVLIKDFARLSGTEIKAQFDSGKQ